MEAYDQLTDALASIETKQKFAHDIKLGYVTSLPKNINDMNIKLKIKVHERMESWSSWGVSTNVNTNNAGTDNKAKDDQKDDENMDDDFMK